MEDLQPLRQAGMERAATAWEIIEQAQPPFDPVNIFKATCSIKCAELLTRLRTTSDPAFLSIIHEFIDGTLTDAGGTGMGSLSEGLRIVQQIETLLPFSVEESVSPTLFATRMHTFDGIILLAASKFGKENEVKERIDKMQMDIAAYMLEAILRRTRAAQV